MDVDATKKSLEQLVEEINLLSPQQIRFHQQAKVKRNMAIKGANGTLYIHPTTTAYNICLYGKTLEVEMYPFMLSLSGKECTGYAQSKKREPFWRVDDFRIVRKAVFRYAGIPFKNIESLLPIVSINVTNKGNTMDPKTVFIEQVNKFLDEFVDVNNWTIKKDSLNNIVILIPSEWVMHSQLNGISLQFALNVKGELVLSISIENPIILESRISFKSDLLELMRNNNFFENTYIGFEASSCEKRFQFCLIVISNYLILLKKASN